MPFTLKQFNLHWICECIATLVQFVQSTVFIIIYRIVTNKKWNSVEEFVRKLDIGGGSNITKVLGVCLKYWQLMVCSRMLLILVLFVICTMNMLCFRSYTTVRWCSSASVRFVRVWYETLTAAWLMSRVQAVPKSCWLRCWLSSILTTLLLSMMKRYICHCCCSTESINTELIVAEVC